VNLAHTGLRIEKKGKTAGAPYIPLWPVARKAPVTRALGIESVAAPQVQHRGLELVAANNERRRRIHDDHCIGRFLLPCALDGASANPRYFA
jgi:hypothetical protein